MITNKNMSHEKFKHLHKKSKLRVVTNKTGYENKTLIIKKERLHL